MREAARRRQEEHFHNWQLTAIKYYSPPSSIFIHLKSSCFQVLVLIVSAAAEKYYVGSDRSFGAPFHYDFILEADWVIQSSSGLCWAPTQDLLRNARPSPGPGRDVTHRDRNWWKIVLARKNIINWSPLGSWLLTFISIQTRSPLDLTLKYTSLLFTATADSILRSTNWWQVFWQEYN